MFRPTFLAGPAGLAALALLPLFSAHRDQPQEAADPTAELIQTLKQKTDTAEPKLIQELGGKRTRQAMEGLLDVYKAMATVYMRREVLRALVLFDGVTDAEQPALQKLMDVATQASEAELRRAALDGLGQCRTHGKDFLRMIVDSPAEDSVREHGMELHVSLATKDDHGWYRELYKPKADEKADKDKEKKERKDKKKAAEASGPKKPKSLNAIRALAFDAIQSTLSDDEMVEAVKDRYARIRMSALEALEGRQDKRTLEIATALYGKMTTPDSANMDLKIHERAEVRTAAARVMGRLAGTKVAPEFIKRAANGETPMELRRALAEILAGFKDPAINRDLIGALGKGRTHDKLFALWAVKGIKDEKVDKALQKQLLDKEAEVVAATCRALAERADMEAVPALKKLVDKGKDRSVVRAALDALAVLRKGEAAWLDELVALTKNEDPELRNLALQALGASSDKSYLPKLVAALDDKNWSTRLAALEALEHLRVKEAISAIIVRMGSEEGRMKDEFANTLWRLTGQPYQDDAKAWDNWWKQAVSSFQILDETELQRVKSGEEEWRLKQSTRVESKFFGIRIISHRVIFIVDVSGSMNEALESEYEGKAGQPRMEVAKRELVKAVQGLDSGALFNIITFSSDVDRWLDGSLAAASEKNRADAKDYAERLGAGGGTNIYGAIKEALTDPDVDTIFFMSDGEPSVGEQTDPVVIREHVAQWNEHRGIVINTIGIGGQFQVLEWLAEDSGGTHVKYE